MLIVKSFLFSVVGGLHALADVAAELIRNLVRDQDERDDDDTDRVARLRHGLRIGEGQERQRVVFFACDQDRDEVEFLCDADEGKQEAGEESVPRKRNDNARDPAPEARAVDRRRLLELNRDLHHVRRTGAAREREMLDDRDQQDQHERTGQRRDQSSQMRLAEHGVVDRGERD